MSDNIGIRKLSNGKNYIVTWADREQGLVHYRKVSDSDAKPYEVGYDKSGETFCNCKGFQFRSRCAHSSDFAELGSELIDIKPASQGVRYPREHFGRAVLMIEEMINPLGRCHVAGSWRRLRPTIRDLDFVTVVSTDKILELFSEHEIDITVHGGSVCRFDISEDEENPFQVDIICTVDECFGAALLHATGSKDFNIFLRRRAKAQGMKLNRHGLFDRTTEKRIAGLTEEEVLKVLDMPFIHPDARDEEKWLTSFD